MVGKHVLTVLGDSMNVYSKLWLIKDRYGFGAVV
jgi:hypothetical protein